MNRFWRTLIAAYGAKKLGGGCLSTILIFFLIYWALGTCNRREVRRPAEIRKEIRLPVSGQPVARAAVYYVRESPIRRRVKG